MPSEWEERTEEYSRGQRSILQERVTRYFLDTSGGFTKPLTHVRSHKAIQLGMLLLRCFQLIARESVYVYLLKAEAIFNR